MLPAKSVIRALLIFSVVFIVGYFGIGLAPHWAAFDASIPLDRMIPFLPAFALFYAAGCVYPFISFFVVPDEKRLASALHGFLFIMAIAFVCFIIFPIELPKHMTYPQGAFAQLIRLWHGFDTTYNNFPSLHVAFSAYGWLVTFYENRKAALITSPIALGIIVSVLFVKTHLFIDLVSGLVLAWGAFAFYRSRLAKEQQADRPVV